MSDDIEFDADAWMRIAAAALGIPIDPAWESGVRANLRREAELAKVVLAVPLAPSDEPMPLIVPPMPE